MLPEATSLQSDTAKIPMINQGATETAVEDMGKITSDCKADDSVEFVRLLDELEPFFDRGFYSALNPELESNDRALLRHFATVGWKEGKNPSPQFQTTHYELAYPEATASGVNPLLHYIRVGRQRGWKCYPGWLSLSSAAIKQCFDAEFYLKRYPDVARARKDPLAHYLAHGCREGRDPHPDICTKEFLKEQPALPPEQIHPFFLFVLLRSAEEPGNYQAIDDLPDVQKLIARQVDKEYYLARYEDVRRRGVDPERHFLRYGNREGRQPSRAFNAKYYTDRYVDVTSSGLSPILHYLTTGLQEGRFGESSLRAEKDAIRTSAKQASRRSREYDEALLSFAALRRAVLQAGKGASTSLVISFSHDIYVRHTGGIQVFIKDEAEAVLQTGGIYLNLAPAVPQLCVCAGKDSERFPVIATLNGQVLGKTTFADVQRVTLDCLEENSGLTSAIVVHSFLGFDPQMIGAFCEEVSPQRPPQYWIHDYSGICPSVTLLRSGIRYCSAPDVGSAACGICPHGSRREESAPAVRSFFERIPAVIMAPSQAARAVWESANIASLPVTVAPHGKLVDAPTVRPSIVASPLRVAFCGFPNFHKGWHLFQELIDAHYGNDLYEFHHFCAEPSSDKRAIHHTVSTAQTERSRSMIDALVEADIDVVLVLSAWPETFCFVAYEALAAGALLVTLSGSGNVSDLAEQYSKRSWIVAERGELVRGFSSDELLRRVRTLRAESNGLQFIKSQSTLLEVAAQEK